jgi:hypothetical protein
MYGSDYQNGEPINLDANSIPHFTNSDGWGAGSVTGVGSGSTPAFGTVQTFVEMWGQNGRAKELTGQDICNSEPACEDSTSPLRTLDVGDVVLYDYKLGAHQWDHVAIVVQRLTDTTPLTVASRGGRTYILPGPNTSGGWECGKNLTPVGGYLNVTGGNTFENGGLQAIGALHINYEGYLP